MEQIIKGQAASPGFAQGPIFIWQEEDLTLPAPYHCDDPAASWQKITTAIAAASAEIIQMRDRVQREVGDEQSAIFDAHLMMIEDPSLHDMVQAALQEGTNPEAAWMEAITVFAELLEDLSDPLLKARAADVRDVGRRVLAHLLGKPTLLNHLEEKAVIVARDLAPSQTAMMDHTLVLAFCTVEGGPTSHTAILAKALGIPAVVALGKEILSIPADETLWVDANAGKVFVRPDETTQKNFLQRSAKAAGQRASDLQAAFEPARTLDGKHFEIVANIGGPEDAAAAVANGAEGVGLFRTEFIYMNRQDMPDFDQQVDIYRQVISILDGRPLVVRTLDIGGDKRVDYLGIDEEPNPFLGWRGIRMISERPDVLRDQFCALLKAGAGTDLRIMLPMVSQVDEVVQARQLFEEALAWIRDEIPGWAAQLQFGIMVEVPSTALMIEQFAPLVDFFSIGTNDLSQYTLAVDRMNGRVSALASPFHPAVLKLIERTVRVAHEHGKWAGLCGEMAGDPLAAPFLVGIGLDEFSMSPASVPAIKQLIRQLNTVDCQSIVPPLLALPSTAKVHAYLQHYLHSAL